MSAQFLLVRLPQIGDFWNTRSLRRSSWSSRRG